MARMMYPNVYMDMYMYMYMYMYMLTVVPLGVVVVLSLEASHILILHIVGSVRCAHVPASTPP